MQIVKNTDLDKILFFDIETVPQHPNYLELSDELQVLWEKKHRYDIEKGKDPTDIYEEAGLSAEFGKIVTISFGIVRLDGSFKSLRVKSCYGDDEYFVLKEFFELLTAHFPYPGYLLCAHNGKNFDIPFLAKRGMIHGLELPSILDISGKKPWEIPHVDTMELWKFGDFRGGASLALLCQIFGIPTPKGDIDGSQVGNVYWNQKDLKRITEYCERDVVALVRLFQKLRGEEMIQDEDVEFVKN
ncbi:MAG: 3'-5' exonuclease [Flavobacteriales bacterium]|nr:3'-5' exonuclease [Flavobacteriales bacterium]